MMSLVEKNMQYTTIAKSLPTVRHDTHCSRKLIALWHGLLTGYFDNLPCLLVLFWQFSLFAGSVLKVCLVCWFYFDSLPCLLCLPSLQLVAACLVLLLVCEPNLYFMICKLEILRPMIKKGLHEALEYKPFFFDSTETTLMMNLGLPCMFCSFLNIWTTNKLLLFSFLEHEAWIASNGWRDCLRMKT